MLDWQEPLFLDESIQDEKSLREKCEKGKALPGYYLVTLSRVKENRFEIIPCDALRRKELRSRLPGIVGMAKGKKRAIELALEILQEKDCRVPRN